MQLDFFFKRQRPVPRADFLTVNGHSVPLVLVRNPRARRYLLRLRHDGAARLTIPRSGSIAEAKRFAERSTNWLARQLQRQAMRPNGVEKWMIGSEVLFRGQSVKIGDCGQAGLVSVDSEIVKVADPTADLRLVIEQHLWNLASKEFPPLVLEFARIHQVLVRRVMVRNQRSRWGSCSRRGTISLNWRLIQTPPFVRDYIILHELMHMRQMNHSRRFWREVERVCPDYRQAERWLKNNSALLRQAS